MSRLQVRAYIGGNRPHEEMSSVGSEDVAKKHEETGQRERPHPDRMEDVKLEEKVGFLGTGRFLP